MYCMNCGKETQNGTLCEACSAAASPALPAAGQTPNAAQSSAKRKRHIGRWIALALSICLISAIVFFVGSIFWFPPRDLGVKYTMADYNSAVKKIGIIKDQTPKQGNIGDYKYVYTGTKNLDVEFTQEELTAWLNENRPSYFALKKVQIKINRDGTAEGAGEVNFDSVKYIINKNIPNVDWSRMPVPIPQKANVYVKSGGSVTDNTPDIEGASASIGSVPVPGAVLSKSNVGVIDDTIKTVLEKEIPTFHIDKIEVKDGKIHFVGQIPEKMERTKISK